MDGDLREATPNTLYRGHVALDVLYFVIYTLYSESGMHSRVKGLAGGQDQKINLLPAWEFEQLTPMRGTKSWKTNNCIFKLRY